ncbi:MAG: AAA family ATPase [Candidatus Woesearchaeota archaeon]
MRFKSIEIVENKLFSKEKIVFNKSLTVIVGDNGTGKTILFNMLKIGVGVKPVGYKLSILGKVNKGHFDLMFANEYFLDTFGENHLMEDWTEKQFEQLFSICDRHIGAYFPKTVNELMNYSSRNQHLQRSERFIGDFAKFLALRHYLKVKDPLVLDCILDRFEPKLRMQIYQVLEKLPYQVILFEHKYKNPDYRLVRDQVTSKTKVVTRGHIRQKTGIK